MQATISNFMKIAESFLKWKKTLWEKEKLLIMSNFSFSNSVFKRLVLQTRKNQGLFEKGLTDTGLIVCHAYVIECLTLTLYEATKFLDLSKLKAFAEDNKKMPLKQLKFVFRSAENFIGEGENPNYCTTQVIS